MSELRNRLVKYASITAAVPAMAAQGAVVYSGNANIVIGTNQSALIDFGPGFGEVFRFEVRSFHTSQYSPPNSNVFHSSTSSGGYSTFTTFTGGSSTRRQTLNALFQLNIGAEGGGYFPNLNTTDPARLSSGNAIGSLTMSPMGTGFGSYYKLAGRQTSFRTRSGSTLRDTSTSFGSWNPDSRGFLGFSMLVNGSTHYGWFDVETRSDLHELVIHAWAFNDEADAPIDAGETPAPGAMGLALLAMGGAGVRRKRRSVA